MWALWNEAAGFYYSTRHHMSRGRKPVVALYGSEAGAASARSKNPQLRYYDVVPVECVVVGPRTGALARACPTCKMPPGWRCRSTGGRTIPHHKARRSAVLYEGGSG